VSSAIAHIVKHFVKLFVIQCGLTFCLSVHTLYEAPLHSLSRLSIRQLNLMYKCWNELLLHWPSGLIISRRSIIWRSTTPIFTKISPNGRYLNVDYTVDLALFFRPLKGRCHSNQFWGKFAYPTVIRRAGLPKRIGVCTSNLNILKFKQQWFLYIVCEFGDVWSSNAGDYEGKNWNFRDDSQNNWLLSPNISECSGPI